MEPMTNVSIRGDKVLTQALKALAYSKGLAVGDLVRNAVNAQYESELAPHLAFFKRVSGDKSIQLDTEVEIRHG